MSARRIKKRWNVAANTTLLAEAAQAAVESRRFLAL